MEVDQHEAEPEDEADRPTTTGLVGIPRKWNIPEDWHTRRFLYKPGDLGPDHGLCFGFNKVHDFRLHDFSLCLLCSEEAAKERKRKRKNKMAAVARKRLKMRFPDAGQCFVCRGDGLIFKANKRDLEDLLAEPLPAPQRLHFF